MKQNKTTKKNDENSIIEKEEKEILIKNKNEGII